MGAYLGVSVLIPALMLLFGWLFLRRPPRRINSIYGYRTARSMQNQETWDFAHRVGGRVWLRTGAVLLAVTLLSALLILGRGERIWKIWRLILVLLQTAVLIGTIVPVERALKENFDDYGRKKER